MKHYVSTAMLERKMIRLRTEIAEIEQKLIKNPRTLKDKTEVLKKLRQDLHETKHLHLTKTNGRKQNG